jgi:hypothetical protein
MLLFLKLLLLLWLINFAPPFLAHILGDRWKTPVDGGRLWKDGRPILGPHKTWRGIVGAVAAGCVGGWLTGVGAGLGVWSAILSMAGDLISSFIKRRRRLPSGSVSAGLDQVFEGVLPLALLAWIHALGLGETLLLLLAFGLGAYVGSMFFKEILLGKPFEDYPRPVASWVRLRELRSCQITSNPLHHLVNFEDAFYYHFFMKSVFRWLGLYEKGMRNALDFEIREVTFTFPDLPPSFDGYSVLFLTDLHLDGLDGLTGRLCELIGTMPVDLCLIGGDLRMKTHGPFDRALAQFSRLAPSIRARDGIIGVLGNHDCTEIIEPMKDLGVQYLVNDSRVIERDGDRIWIVGADDPHYYKCHDLEDAFSSSSTGDFRVLVVHSNEVYREASHFAPHLYLCGHTHAGQICLPRIGPVFTHSRAPRKLCSGAWQYGPMVGYTSSGVGVSGIPVRFASRGEVTRIVLRRGPERSVAISTQDGRPAFPTTP